MASVLVFFGLRFCFCIQFFRLRCGCRLVLVGCRAGGLRGRQVVVSAPGGQCFFAVFFVFGGLVVFHVGWAGCALRFSGGWGVWFCGLFLVWRFHFRCGFSFVGGDGRVFEVVLVFLVCL